MSTEERAQAFKRFVDSVERPGENFRESVDVETLLSLEKEERRAAEELLMERLLVDDWRAPPALAAAETRGAVMPMQRALPDASGRMKVAIARALEDLEAIPKADPIVAEVIREGDEDSGPPAVVAAGQMKSPEIRDALAWACIHHPTRVVRVSAGATLLFMAGLAKSPLALEFRPLIRGLRDDDEATRRATFAQICHLVGMPPELADT
ncbi:HEAT repeat domain-containing protein [Polyangium fumosum]|uniref:HEAT repeat domain-containing protein n=1 Tax=Polyangium fumosum TaxID=889272 RepID=A0A4U1J9K5_9BACT|nr:hypothetical protein [Polyangium fumosum]TKD04491.1 hypothetical protein E8A74_23055 [Polyangium fumosum]